MVDWIKKSARAFSEKGGIFMFIRAQFLHKSPVRQTFWSQWTFKSKECKKRHVIVKYLLVWIGSILLNTWGIYFMTETISRNPWVQETLKHYIDDLFVFSKIVVSLLVGFLWNYNMQRIFVYKNCRIRDRFQKANSK